MNKYGLTAIQAVEIIATGSTSDPKVAWAIAASNVFPDSKSSREKSCPKGAFLGLCEDGVVQGVPPGEYTSSHLNKRYARRALDALKSSPGLVEDEAKLWEIAVEGVKKVTNNQMAVVTALWRRGYLDPT
ncbi:MAG: hypothetical protein EOO29_23125 [Comamonadaceae bacterium]|nr:MAG: hypothetical protein EOO29_23125 [Comamonadaceae bacterium]